MSELFFFESVVCCVAGLFPVSRELCRRSFVAFMSTVQTHRNRSEKINRPQIINREINIRTMMSSTALVARAASRSLTLSARPQSKIAALSKFQYSSSAIALGGAPPLPPFARIPPESEKLVEQYDAIWDDGVAPEVTLDFDCQHISSGEGLAMWFGGFAFFVTMYQVVKASDPQAKNPAVNRRMNIVGENPVELGGWKKLVDK